jgi:hypothetical protein
MDSKNYNYAACTKQGCKYKKWFHNNKEWEQFKKDEIEITRQLNKVLAEQAKLAIKIARLFKQQEFLRSKGKQMLDHDTMVMNQLDKEDLFLGLSPNQLLDQMSPGFWANIGAIADKNPKAVAGNLSDY